MTDIFTKCHSYYITKSDKGLSQNATVITKRAHLITKCDSYYIMRPLLENASIHLCMRAFAKA